MKFIFVFKKCVYLETVSRKLSVQEEVDEVDVEDHVDKEQEVCQVQLQGPDVVSVQTLHKICSQGFVPVNSRVSLIQPNNQV